MKKHWKTLKSIVVLAVLPLVATAVASAHHMLSDSDPISVDTDGLVVAEVDELGSTRVHTVALNRMGAVEGRIASIHQETRQSSGLSDLKVFFIQNGEIAKEAVTLEDGTFIVEGLAEGAYSFVATGKNGFAAYGVRVVANGGTEEVNVMEAAAVSPRFGAVKNILNSNLPATVTEQILDSSESVSEPVVGANRVRLENGTLTGHVVPIQGQIKAVEGTYVHILRDDQQVAAVQANAEGGFSVADLEPGVYDFVAAGPTGIAAVSFEAVAQEEAGSVADLIVEADTEELPVAVDPGQDVIAADIPFDAGYSNSLDVCLTCGDAGYITDQVGYSSEIAYQDAYYDAPIEYAGEAIGYGCAAGGSCGSCGDFSGYSSCGGCGGGGGYGGGKLGAILGMGALAVGIIALTDDDNKKGKGKGKRPKDPRPMSPHKKHYGPTHY